MVQISHMYNLTTKKEQTTIFPRVGVINLGKYILISGSGDRSIINVIKKFIEHEESHEEGQVFRDICCLYSSFPPPFWRRHAALFKERGRCERERISLYL